MTEPGAMGGWTRSKTWFFALLFAAWMLPGLVGRDPWKADEAYSFGLVLNMSQSGDWVVPTLGSDPFMEKPPIFYLTATLFERLLSWALQPHEAARGACVLFAGLTLLFAALAGRELYGRGGGRTSALLLMGAVGLVHTAHMLQTDLALVAGYAMAIYGLTLALRRPWAGGIICGTGTGLAFLSKGLLGPGALGVAVLLLPVFGQNWRGRNYGQLLAGILLAVLPWVTVWPALLYQRSPSLFVDWFWNNNVARLVGGSPYAGPEHRPAWFYATLLCGFGFPVFPLALWGLWRGGRKMLGEPAVQAVLLPCVTLFLVLSAASQKRSLYATPLLVPLALLGVRGLAALGERFARGAMWFVGGLGTLAAGLAWLGWCAVAAGWPPALLQRIHSATPHFTTALWPVALVGAVAGTAGWVILLRSRAETGPPALAFRWAGATALLYLLGMTLWLPVTNGSSSYRFDFAGLREAAGESPGLMSCVGLGEPQRAMVHYYTGLKPLRAETHEKLETKWQLIQGGDREGKRPRPPGPGWKLAWSGRHQQELFSLYHLEP